ncbi:MAG: hypothetical protein ACYTBJ_14675 [Planctomycetota bacterium]
MIERKTIMVLVPVGVAVVVLGIILLATRNGCNAEPGGPPEGSPDESRTVTSPPGDQGVEAGPSRVSADKDPQIAEGGPRYFEPNDVITVVVTEYPDQTAKGSLLAIYSDGRQERRSDDSESPGRMTLAAPNRLGGELTVYMRPQDGQPKLWAFIGKLDKKQVSLPADADLMVGNQDLARVYLSFADEDRNLLENCRGVAFCSSVDSKAPLFFAALHDGAVQVTDYNSVPVDIVPGSYYMRAIISGNGKETFVPLGRVEVDKEAREPYKIHLPSK